MGWALTLSNLRLVPQLVPQNVTLDSPDVIMDTAIQSKVFNYLNNSFLINESIYKEEFYLRRMHNLLTDFISQMPQKVKEMRLRAEETDRTIHAYMHEGLEPPANLPHNFEQLLMCLWRLYYMDPLNLKLELDFWCPPESFHVSTFPYRSQPKQASLYSFVVQTGEVLPPTLFVPYLRMLCSLASCSRGAAQCFTLLKTNENKNLSWDHFFSSLNRYFNNLKQEIMPTTDTVYKHRVFNKGITPQEVQGLHAVLELIKSVAENDPACAEAFCQTSSWSALGVLLGLVTCSVQVSLKAQLLLTLAALSRSATTSATIWYSLEASQVITTVPTTTTYHPRGIQTEIEEVECRNEEYPLTRAILRLLDALTDSPMPRFLGASSRIPGFDPYLNFILNSILLRFGSRSYKNLKEKWEICDLCMGLISKLLCQYDPSTDEFLAKHVQAYTSGTAQVNPPPGYHLMISLCSKSELLRMMLLLLDETCRLLDSYSVFPGKTHMESSALWCLRALEHALTIQSSFLSGLTAANSSLLLIGLNRLIMGINEQTNKPDHLLNVAKFVTYHSWLPEHALPAVNILLLVTSYPTPPAHLLSIFMSTPSLKTTIRHGFVSCLEAEEVDEASPDDPDDLLGETSSPVTRSTTTKRVVTKTKLAICRLLLQSLGQAVPNVAHYLFGFDLNKEIKKTIFQQPGVLGMPRSCLHSVLSQLNGALLDPRESSPGLLEMYYRLIYTLASNPRTSEPTLRFLRSSSEFLKCHLAALPFPRTQFVLYSGCDLNQSAWLLKTVAIEMRVTAVNQQLSQLTGMIEVFIGGGGGGARPQNGTDLSGNTSSFIGDRVRGNEQLVLQLIKHVDFSMETVTPPTLEHFDLRLIEKVNVLCLHIYFLTLL
ncbi:hypothetical protein AAG570_011815 [Ranatra chinensis]|uniref:Uncharacterized protein n=1 Tax=Ranatra chinensis TaxID=642074 RepID=A0ABD0YHF3_9HEMI